MLSAATPLIYETHMHTPLCRHAEGTPTAYALRAAERGFKGITVTCHAPLPDGYSPSVRMRREEWSDYVQWVRETAQALEGEVDVRLGLESDFIPGLEPWLKELHAREPLHYVLGSVHPQTPEYQERYLDGDWPAFHRHYFTSLAEAAETGLFDALSHPDLVKNYGSEAYDLEALLPHIRDCLDRIADTGVAMELNTSGLNKRVPEMNPGPDILAEMRRRDIPAVVGADAHHPDRVGADFDLAYAALEAAGYEEVWLFEAREPYAVSIAEARQSLLPPTPDLST